MTPSLSPHASRPSTPAAAAAAEARFAERLEQRRRRRWIRTGIGALVAVVLLAAGWVVCFSNVLAVKSVQVAGELRRLDAEQVERVADVPHGGALALLDTAPIEARVRTLAPVADVHVERKFPNTVRIEVTERTPVAVLDTPHGRRLVDAEGVAYAAAGDTGSRYVVVETKHDQLPPEALISVNRMIAALPELVRAKVKTVEADSDQDMTAVLSDGRKIVWGGPDQAEFKTKVLEVMLRNKSTKTARTFDVSVPEAPTVKR
ncbi:MAG TPA: FtsQ-type POTRA domain-containing protein [Sporichthya sp.]|nr:FtsQ-type POTRA domain-containing protein [Sporichthya sp.]